MFWQVRALLDDRPGALAALAVSCGDQLVNILGLQIFPTADGRVVDELVLHTPGGWSAEDVEQLCVLAGVDRPTVTACSARALEDPAVRHVRAARVVFEEPELLEEQLCRLLDAFPADGLPGLGSLVLDDHEGPPVRLSRRVPFTDTELARASELRRVASGTEPGVRAEPGDVLLRRGTVADADALIAMHRRCSSETVYRRYHAPMSRVTPRLARSLLEPADGLSMVLVMDGGVVGAGLLASGPGGPELGIMVEDRWQRRGLGTRLLRALVEEAAHLGLERVTCIVQPDNEAVLPTIHRAGLQARVSLADGLTRYQIPLRRVRESASLRKRSNRPAMGEITTPLVALLHGRRELREVYPAADLIDQAVRGGA